VQFAGLADHVFAIGQDGSLRQWEESLQDMRPEEDLDEINSSENHTNSNPQSKGEHTNRSQPVQKGRQPIVADRVVYKAYFKSIGALDVLVFFCFGVAFAFCLKFPGKSSQ
jgi:ATP-binding cassette, subfamily C (CFTR/MRP), member 1